MIDEPRKIGFCRPMTGKNYMKQAQTIETSDSPGISSDFLRKRQEYVRQKSGVANSQVWNSR